MKVTPLSWLSFFLSQVCYTFFMSTEIKLYTRDEANKLIQKLEPLIVALREKRKGLLDGELEIDALEIVTQKQDGEASPILHEKIGSYNHSVKSFYEILEKIHSYGCLLRDVERGEVDFYSNYRGRLVFLCWVYPEKEIQFWHECARDGDYRKPYLQE